jgi:hypothetical protein
LTINNQAINLSGKIIDKQSQPISNVKVTLVNEGIVTYSNHNGNFEIIETGSVSHLNKLKGKFEEIYFDGEAIYFIGSGNTTSISIFDISGRLIYSFKLESTEPDNKYLFYPSAYLPPADHKIYLVFMNTGDQLKSIKLFHHNQIKREKGIQKLSTSQKENMPLKNTAQSNAADKLTLEHSGYQDKEINISSYTQNLGNITLIAPSVNAPTISAPAASDGSFTVTMNYDWNTLLTSSSDRYELEESTKSSSSGFTQIENSGLGNRPQPYEVSLTRSSGTYYYRARVYDRFAFSDYSNVISVNVSAPVTPSSPSGFSVEARDPKSVRLKWTDNSNNETGFEIQRETSVGSNSYVTIYTTSSNAVYYSDNNLTTTSLGYRIRAVNGSASSNWTAKTFAPPKLRIINNLYNGITTFEGKQTDWSNLNCIVNVRIGPSSVDLSTQPSYEKLEPKSSSYSYDFDYIQPAGSANPTSSNYEDFDISSYGYGAFYRIYIQCGYWEYDAFITYGWIKTLSTVLCTNSACCCYKWSMFGATNHYAGYLVIYATDYLPQRHWNGM